LSLFTGCTPPHAAEAPRLTVLGLTSLAGSQLRSDALDDFTRSTGIQVDLIPTPGTSSEQTKLVLKLLNGHATTPDVYLIDVIWPGTLHDYLLDLTPYLNDETHRQLAALKDNGTVGGRVVSLPFYVNTGMLYYRKDLLKKYGYTSPPTTWQELARMASLIQNGQRQRGQKQFWGYLWQGGAYEGLTCNALEWQASFGGGHIIESDGTITVNNPRTAQAMRNAASWVGSISPESVLSYTEADTLQGFTAGNAAFMRHWSSAFRTIREAMPAGSVAVAPLPAGPAGQAQTVGGFGLSVSRYSAHQPEAAALVLYLTGQQVEMRRALSRGYLPTYADLYSRSDLAQAIPESAVLRTIAPSSWAVRPAAVTGSKYAEVSKAYYDGVHEILAGKVRAGSALAALGRRLSVITGLHEANPGQTHEP
jgi:trehalose/maltose transport system substrate-binding protein